MSSGSRAGCSSSPGQWLNGRSALKRPRGRVSGFICQRSILSDERLIEFDERTARELAGTFGIPHDKIIRDTDREED
jgi:hypothetical protein